jgi:toxin ParE1/3/4
MPYRISRRADQDIIDIYLWGHRRFGPPRAELYHDALMQTFDLIAENPRIARERPQFVPAVRIYPHQSHLVIYGLEGEDVLILRVLHGRQEWERHL